MKTALIATGIIFIVLSLGGSTSMGVTGGLLLLIGVVIKKPVDANQNTVK